MDVRKDEEIRAIAEAVVDLLEERGLLMAADPTLTRVLTVADVAELLGRSRPWIYEHAAELGAFRFGKGPKARLGFDRAAIERWKRDSQIATANTPSRRERSKRRRGRAATPAAVNLIPYDPWQH